MYEKKNKKTKTKKSKRAKTKTPAFEWRGCLADLRDKYTSVELQHKCINDIF